MHLHTIDWVIVFASLLICFVPALFFGKRVGQEHVGVFRVGAGGAVVAGGAVDGGDHVFSSDTPNLVTDFVRTAGRGGQLGVVGLHADGRGDGVLLRAALAALGRDHRPGVLRAALLGQRGERRAGLPLGVPRLFFNCMIMATVNLAACKIAGVLFGLERWQTLLVVGLLNVVFAAHSGLVGRAGHRHGAVLHQDVGGDRGGVFCGHATAGGRVVRAWSTKLSHTQRAGRDQLPEHAAGFHEQLGPGGGGVHHAAGGAVVGGLVSGRGAGRRQLHRAAHARFEIGEGRAGRHAVLQCRALRPAALAVDSDGPVLRIIIYPQLSDIQKAFPHLDPTLLGHDIAFPAMLKFLPVGLHWPHGGRPDRGQFLHHPDAPELGRVLPGTRFLPAIHTPGRHREALCVCGTAWRRFCFLWRRRRWCSCWIRRRRTSTSCCKWAPARACCTWSAGSGGA